MTTLLLVVAGYLAGSLPFGYWVGRAKGVDVRTIGQRQHRRDERLARARLALRPARRPARRREGVRAGAARRPARRRPEPACSPAPRRCSATGGRSSSGFARGGKTVATAGGVFFAVAPVVGLGPLRRLDRRRSSRPATPRSPRSSPRSAAGPRRRVRRAVAGDRVRVRRVRGRRRPPPGEPAPAARRDGEPLPAAPPGGGARLAHCAEIRGRRPRYVAAQPVGERRVPRGRLAARELAAQLADGPVALGEHVVRVDRLQVDLPREQEVAVVEPRRSASSASLSATRTESSTKRGCRCACSTTNSSSGRFSSS